MSELNPAARVVNVYVARFVVVDCPFCGARHRHHWDLQDAQPPGTHMSHCRQKSIRKLYQLTLPTRTGHGG